MCEKDIKDLIKNSSHMSESEKNDQIINFAYGNTLIENKYVTKEMVIQAFTTEKNGNS